MTERKASKVQPGSEIDLSYDSKVDSYKAQIASTWAEDTRWKLEARRLLGFWVPIVLLLEIVFVCAVTGYLVTFGHKLPYSPSDYELLVSAFNVGVIAQTAYTFNIMVKWIFSEVNYKDHPYLDT